MGYRIDYNASIKGQRRKGRRRWIAAGLIAAAIVAAKLCWPQGSQILRGVLFPMDIDDVRSGWSCFAEQLQCGGSFRDALMAFCREILTGAEIA